MSYRPQAPVRGPRGGSRSIYRRRRRPRWGRIIPILLTFVVLVVVVLRACVGGGGGTTDLTSYVDAARPLIQRSNETGMQLKRIPQELPNLTRDDLARRLDQMSAEAAAVSDDAARTLVKVPTVAVPANGHLLTAFKARSVGLVEIKPAILEANLNPDEGLAIVTFQAAVNRLVLSDLAYAFFSDDIKAQLDKGRRRPEVPVSTYLADTELARADKQAEFVKRVRESEKLKATENVAIADFKTEPSGSGDGENLQLPPANSFEVLVTVVNKGNTRAERTVVRAELRYAGKPDPQTDSATIDLLEPGDSKTVALRNLQPARGDPINRVDIEVLAPGDRDTTDNKTFFKFQFRR